MVVEVGSAGGVVVVSVLTTILSVCPCMDVCVYSLPEFYSCRSVVPSAVLDYPDVASSDSRAERSCATTVGFQASQPLHELSTYFYITRPAQKHFNAVCRAQRVSDPPSVGAAQIGR